MAQTVGRAPAQYRNDVWTTEQGLPQNSVNALAQTRDGYLWIGTFGGLARFDGVKFTSFDAANTKGIHSSRILSLYEDRAGSLWIATESGGLTRFSRGVFTTFTTKDGLPVDSVSSICEDRQGRLWLGTPRGLVRFEAGSFTTYTTRDGLPDNRIAAIIEDREESLWVGTLQGLARLKDGQITTYTTGLPGNDISVIRECRDGSLWVGTNDGGIVRFRGGAVITYTKANGLASNKVRRIYEDRSGTLWVSSTGGINLLREGVLTNVAIPFDQAENVVNDILEDREGNLWLGTGVSGIMRLKGQQLTVFAKEQGLPQEVVVPIIEGSQGEIWMGLTCGGLVRLSEGKVATYTKQDGLPNNCIWSLLVDREGTLWIGTWGGGLTQFKGGKFFTYTHSNSGLSDDGVLSLYQDREGVIWVGTGNGLNGLKDGAFTTYRRANGLVHEDVRFITEDHQGALWIGTTGGLSRLKDGKFTNYTTEQGLSHNFVRAIHESADGALWLGTYGGGLNRFKGGKFTHYHTGNGLYDNVVSRILEDERGNFWMSGNRGIFRVSRQELDDYADGKTAGVVCTSYGVADGMKSNECNGGGQPAGWKTRAGRLWFPTAKGSVVIDPRAITINELPPPVVIEQVLVDKVAVDSSAGIELRPGQQDLEIHYTALSFVASEKVRFKYQLVGLDNTWTEVGTRRAVYYSHLPPGRYTFNVAAANSDGVWNLAGASIRLVVVPPFWRTWWFLSAAILGLLGAAALTYHLRVSQLRRAHAMQEEFSRRLIDSQERERKRIAGELHDSLGQSLAIIKNRALFGIHGATDFEAAKEQFNQISAQSSQAIDEVKEISYNLRPYLLDRLGLTKSIEAMLNKVANSSAVQFSADLDTLDGLFPPEAEINFYRIVQESLNNIIKHAEATEAQVLIKRGGQTVEMTIQDNGQGFDLEGNGDNGRPRQGFGLIGITERARMLGAQPLIRSAPGRGTIVTMIFPLKEGWKEEHNGAANPDRHG